MADISFKDVEVLFQIVGKTIKFYRVMDKERWHNELLKAAQAACGIGKMTTSGETKKFIGEIEGLLLLCHCFYIRRPFYHFNITVI